jgi:hypothetical protein
MMEPRTRPWSCLVLEPNDAAAGNPLGLAYVHTVALPRGKSGPHSCEPAVVAAELDRLLSVKEGREPIPLRSKHKRRAGEISVYINDYRDARDEAELALARGLARNYAAYEVLAPLGYHSIMRERHFRGRLVVTGPGQQTLPSDVAQALRGRWESYCDSPEGRAIALLAETRPF